MSIRAVLFDLDNTLADRRAAFAVYTERLIDAFIEVGGGMERREIAETIRLADRNGYRQKSELYAELLQSLPFRDSSVTVEDLLTFWFAEFPGCTIAMDGAAEVLAALRGRGMKLGIVTNGSGASQRGKIDRAGFRRLVDDVIVSDEVRMKKPERGIFELALQRLGVTAGEAVFVGDHPVNDVRGAAEAGMRAVWLAGFMKPAAEGPLPERSIRKLSELPGLLTALQEGGS